MEVVSAPGRINLIGEHLDYHQLDVLPMALRQRITLRWQPRTDSRIRVTSRDGFPAREFLWDGPLSPVAAGDWGNYLRAAAEAVRQRWGLGRGIDAEASATLPPAAGLSSSSALIVAVTLALLRANGRAAGFDELMDVLPDGEHFVGTRGGGMDHAASLGSRVGCASLISFAPTRLRPIPIPAGWAFLAAHTLKTAEKSGPMRDEYNARRAGSQSAPARLGFSSYREALTGRSFDELRHRARALTDPREHDAFLHVVSEGLRVREAVTALERDELDTFARLMNESHASCRDWLRISCPELDELVDAARAAGARGARLTGAGFGGCAVILAREPEIAAIRERLKASYYASRPTFVESSHLLDARPGDGALA